MALPRKPFPIRPRSEHEMDHAASGSYRPPATSWFITIFRSRSVLPRVPQAILWTVDFSSRRVERLYAQRGNQSGSDLGDWLRAEQEILQDEAIDEKAAELFGQP